MKRRDQHQNWFIIFCAVVLVLKFFNLPLNDNWVIPFKIGSKDRSLLVAMSALVACYHLGCGMRYQLAVERLKAMCAHDFANAIAPKPGKVQLWFAALILLPTLAWAEFSAFGDLEDVVAKALGIH